MTPLDCAGFDVAIQEYLNADYYNCTATGSEVVSRIAALRETRETELYLIIIKTFYKVIERITKEKDKSYGTAVLTKVFRPWGRNTESVECWALSLHCLLRDNPPNIYHPKGRPSVFSLIAKEMPLMAFPFTVDLLKDALRLFVTPYGQIADTEPVKFPQCDCLKDKSVPPVAFKHLLPCEKPAVVLCIAIYTEEETVRRDLEEKELFDIFYVSLHGSLFHLPALFCSIPLLRRLLFCLPLFSSIMYRSKHIPNFPHIFIFSFRIFVRMICFGILLPQELELDICAWLQTSEGIRCLNTECTKRMALDVSDIKVRETLILSEQVKLRDSRIKKVGVLRKIKMYRGGDPHYMHGIANDEAADELGAKADAEVQKHTSRLAIINQSIDRLTLQTKYSPVVQRNLASEDLLKKYAHVVYAAALLPLRKFAAQKGLGRPWDGPNGATFIDWEKRFHRGNKSVLSSASASAGIQEEESSSDEDDDDDRTVQSYNPSHSQIKIKTVDQSLELSRQAGTLVLSTMRSTSEKANYSRKNHVTDMSPSRPADDDDGRHY